VEEGRGEGGIDSRVFLALQKIIIVRVAKLKIN
jgi:hypothetical protein